MLPGVAVPVLSLGRHSTRNVTTGSGRPFSSSAPTGVNWWGARDPATRRTISAHRISPPAACAQMRAASTTGVPWTSSSSTLASPRLRPLRTDRCSGDVWLNSLMSCWMVTAQASPSAAPWNTAMIPSPVVLTTWPL